MSSLELLEFLCILPDFDGAQQKYVVPDFTRLHVYFPLEHCLDILSMIRCLDLSV